MAKTVADTAAAMDALVAFDPNNIWNPYIPDVEAARPSSYLDFLDNTALEGKVLGLPKAYIGKGDPAIGPGFSNPVDPQVGAAFEAAKQVLEAQGATLIEVDIPTSRNLADISLFDIRGTAFYYEKLIQEYNDEEIQSLVDLLGVTPVETLIENQILLGAIFTVINGEEQPWEELPEVEQVLNEIAQRRTQDYENFMAENNIDAFVFPTLNYLAPTAVPGNSINVYAQFGVRPASSEVNLLGLPAITVPMGYSDEGIPMSLEFMGNYFGEQEIISYAYDYEQATRFRRPPTLFPSLPGETFEYTPIPEPGSGPTLAVFGLGILGYGLKRRRFPE